MAHGIAPQVGGSALYLGGSDAHITTSDLRRSVTTSDPSTGNSQVGAWSVKQCEAHGNDPSDITCGILEITMIARLTAPSSILMEFKALNTNNESITALGFSTLKPDVKWPNHTKPMVQRGLPKFSETSALRAWDSNFVAPARANREGTHHCQIPCKQCTCGQKLICNWW